MMKHFSIYNLLVLFILLITSCDEEKLTDTRIDIPDTNTTELDEWIDATFRVPYNIRVQYKWNSAEMDPNKELVPPKEELIQSFLKAVHKIWINPYTKVAKSNEEFMKDYSCRQLALIGSGSWNVGSITLGMASNGYKISLYVVNQFDLREGQNGPSYGDLNQFFRTMHHEFGHILNQRKAYDPNFKSLTGNYSADWTSMSDSEARELGFISAYARSADSEDFVEVLSYFITFTPTEWDDLLNSIKSTTGREYILLKLQSVTSYMNDFFGVDILLLRNEITKAITEVADGIL